METMEYFDCEVDVGYADEGSKLAGLLVRLPCYGPHSRARDFCYLRVNSCSTKDATKYIADYTIEKVSCWVARLGVTLNLAEYRNLAQWKT